MVNIFIKHVQDVGRENNKSATVFTDKVTFKTYNVFRSNKPSLYNEVTEQFNVKDVPVIAIKEKVGDEVSQTRYYINGEFAYASVSDTVSAVIKIDGDENVLPNLPTFCIMDLIKNCEAFKRLIKDDFKAETTIVMALTKKMRDLPLADHIKEKMLKTKYECTYYPKGLDKKELAYSQSFSFKYDETKDLNKNDSISYNLQGSMCALAYLHDPSTLNFRPEVYGNFVEGGAPSATGKASKFIEDKFNQDYITIDCSSREMTLNIIDRNMPKFNASKTIPFGSYDVFSKMKDILSKLVENKRLEIDWIKAEYMKNTVIKNERMGKPSFGKDKYDKESYTMAEIYQMAYDKLHHDLYKKILTEYKNLTSFMTHINPQFIVLCGGGIYSNHGQQSPFVRLAIDLVKDVLDKSITDDNKCYEYILPHGLYSTGEHKYIVNYEDHKDFILAHAVGTSLQFISMLNRIKESKTTKK